MIFTDLLERFNKLHLFVSEHPDAVLCFVDELGDSLEVTFDTAYETDNGLEIEDSNYEEYEAIAFSEKTTGKLFEIAYFNLPYEVWRNNDRII